VLGAFAGLRPEEIAPPTKAGAKKRDKRGLACEDIDWRFSAVMVPAEVSKVDTPRRVPMSDALRAGLEWAGIRPGMTGPVCLKNPVEERELFRLGKLLFGAAGWPKNALRHSYGSYRNAVIRDLPRLAEEMGTSVGMLNHRYHNPQPEELGEAWFGLDFAADEFRKSSAELDLEQRSGENPARAIC
jgi:integrase